MNNNAVMRKIKACLALARSNNPHEAATALRQAQALMEKYNVGHAEVAASDVGSQVMDTGAGRTPPAHIAILINIICLAFGVKAVWRATWKANRWAGLCEFYGVGSAAEVAGYAFDVLSRQLRRDRAAFFDKLNSRMKRATKVRRADLYAQGWVAAVVTKVTPHDSTEQETRALEAYAQQRWRGALEDGKTIDRTQQAKARDHSSYWQGHTDGRRANYHQGVTGKGQAAIGQSGG